MKKTDDGLIFHVPDKRFRRVKVHLHSFSIEKCDITKDNFLSYAVCILGNRPKKSLMAELDLVLSNLIIRSLERWVEILEKEMIE